ncbi:hypothetical protein HYC85_014351 [Camellia sinensis]|uniref:Uncharacterized protein n=1 Tax=Camellia sinensis TaxID=4442 RepID=A0A7J7H968_CAMSI|nr:hypothetical protein HYC85_014351 [Camellia sinensis]
MVFLFSFPPNNTTSSLCLLRSTRSTVYKMMVGYNTKPGAHTQKPVAEETVGPTPYYPFALSKQNYCDKGTGFPNRLSQIRLLVSQRDSIQPSVIPNLSCSLSINTFKYQTLQSTFIKNQERNREKKKRKEKLQKK